VVKEVLRIASFLAAALALSALYSCATDSDSIAPDPSVVRAEKRAAAVAAAPSSKSLKLPAFTAVSLKGRVDAVFHFGNEFKITISGSAEAVSQTTALVEKDQLTATFSGKLLSKVYLDIYLRELDRLRTQNIRTALLGDGIGGALRIRKHGLGSIDASNYEVENANVLASGVGSVTVWASDELVIHNRGFAHVMYIGSPTVTYNWQD
jgi:hypothetical protein